jgi:hypothetical protein
MRKFLLLLSLSTCFAASPLTNVAPFTVQFSTNNNVRPNGLNAVMGTVYSSNFNGVVLGRELTNILSDVLNVRNNPFNAPVNTLSDSSASINTAILTHGTYGGQVYLPKGVYVITNTITLTNNIDFGGVYANVVDNDTNRLYGTTLFWAGPTNIPMFKLFGVNGVHLHDFKIDGNGTPGFTAIDIDSVNNPPTHTIFIDRIQCRNRH